MINRNFIIFIYIIMVMCKNAIQWDIKDQEYFKLNSTMKQRLQQYLFPPKIQNVDQSGMSQVLTNLKPYSQGELEKLYNSQSHPLNRRKKREIIDKEKIYVLLPFEKNVRKLRRSNLIQDRIRIDLARTDIPWDIPSSVVLNDGVRKILLEMVTTPAEKRKKSIYIPNVIPYSTYLEDEYKKKMKQMQNNLSVSKKTKNDTRDEHDHNLKLLLTESEKSGKHCYQPTTIKTRTEGTTKFNEKCTTTLKLPICVNFQISNIIPPDIVNEIKILNNSRIDSTGNVRMNILFLHYKTTTKSPLCSILCGNSSNLVTSENYDKVYDTKEINQVLENARLENLNSMNRWISNNTLQPFTIVKKKDDKKISKIVDNQGTFKQLIQLVKSVNHTTPKPYFNFADLDLKLSNLPLEAQNSMDDLMAHPCENSQLLLTSNTTTLNLNRNDTTLNNDNNNLDVNNTLAMKTLINLIKMMQTNYQHENVKQ